MQSSIQQDSICLERIKSIQKNIRYQKGIRECKLHSDNLITIIDNDDSSKVMYLYLFDYLFNHSISYVNQFSIFFNKENHIVNDNTVVNNILDMTCDINLDKNSAHFYGCEGCMRFRIGERNIKWYNSLFSVFDNSYTVYSKNKNGVNELNYNQFNNSKDLLIFLNGYNLDKLNVVEITNSSYGVCEVNSVKSGGIESILLNYSSNLNTDFYIQLKQIPYKFQNIKDEYGVHVAIKLLGYTPYSLYKISSFVSYILKNDSNSAIVSLIILLLMLQGTPYLLLLLMKLIRRRYNSKNKHINDNEDTFSYVISLIIKNWKYIINVFIIYSIYGITSSRNILQKLEIKDGTFLNFGKSILEADNTFLFLKTRFGYLSILKLILFLSLAFKQISFISNNTNMCNKIDTNRKIIMIIIMLLFIYAMRINYSFMIIIIITNLFLGFGDVAINNITN